MLGTKSRTHKNTQAEALELLDKAVDQHGHEDAVRIFWNANEMPETLRGRPPRHQYKVTRQLVSTGSVTNIEGAVERLKEASY